MIYHSEKSFDNIVRQEFIQELWFGKFGFIVKASVGEQSLRRNRHLYETTSSNSL